MLPQHDYQSGRVICIALVFFLTQIQNQELNISLRCGTCRGVVDCRAGRTRHFHSRYPRGHCQMLKQIIEC